MSSRVAGAGLALFAAALLAVSIATPVVLPAALSIFAGHPTVKEHTRETQDMYVGLYDARLCNSGGDGTCKSGDARAAFRVIAYGELGATGLGTLSLVMLGVLTLQRSDSRKRPAQLVRIANVIGIAGMGGLIVISPFGSEAAIPLGVGAILHAIGLLGGLVASVIAIRPPAPIKLRSSKAQPAMTNGRPGPQGQPMHASGHQGQQGQPMPSYATTARGQAPGPMHDHRPPAHGGYATPGYASVHPSQMPGYPAQLGPDHAPGPLPPFAPHGMPVGTDHGRQLRPLYEMQGVQIERPVVPAQPPQRAMFEVDIDVEPSMVVPMPTAPGAAAMMPPPAPMPVAPTPPPPMMPTPSATMPSPPPPPPTGERARAGKTLPPPMPMRARPTSGPPPLPPQRTQASAAQAAMDVDGDAVVAAAPFAFGPSTAEHASEPEPGHHERGLSISDGRPEPVGGPSTEPTMFPDLATPPSAQPVMAMEIDDEPVPVHEAVTVPAPSPRKSPARTMQVPELASLAQVPATPTPAPMPAVPPQYTAPLPAVAQPRANRETQSPPPRPAALRASVPMPARPNRPTMPTRPPPVTARTAVPKTTIAAPVVPPPIIPPIPAIPMPGRVQVEISESSGQTNISDAPSADDPGTAPVMLPPEPIEPNSDARIDAAFIAAFDERAHATGDSTDASSVRPSDTSPHGEPVAPPPTNGAYAAAMPTPPPLPAVTVAPPGAPTMFAPAAASVTATAFPVPIAIPGPTPVVRDRPMPKLPISTAPDSLPPPRDSKQQAGPSPACPQCESPMNWVEEHLRFYCKSCRMYF